MTGFDADTTFGVYAPGGTPAPRGDAAARRDQQGAGDAEGAEVIKGIGGEPAAQSRADFIAGQNARPRA
jgi:hypothetical protein